MACVATVCYRNGVEEDTGTLGLKAQGLKDERESFNVKE